MHRPVPPNFAKTAPITVTYVDVFVQHKTARVERPLTYAVPAEMRVEIGDVVRVPLGPRELYGFVISSPRDRAGTTGVRPIVARIDVARAFDANGLALARWIAERYCCSLGEALGPLTFAAAIPRVVDRFVVALPPTVDAFPTVPPRLVRLVAGDFVAGSRRCCAIPRRGARATVARFWTRSSCCNAAVRSCASGRSFLRGSPSCVRKCSPRRAWP